MTKTAIYAKDIPWELSEVLEKVADYLNAQASVTTALLDLGTLTPHRFPELGASKEAFVRACVWFPHLDSTDGSVRLTQPAMWISYQASRPDATDWDPDRSTRALQRAIYATLQGEEIALERGRMLLPLMREQSMSTLLYDEEYDVLSGRDVWRPTLAPV